MKRKIIAALTLGSILSLGVLLMPKNGKGSVSAPYGLYRSPFRYVIVRNDFVKAASIRQVGILMEDDDFTEENLKSIYQLVVKRFPEPYDMNIEVYTSLVDAPTPEEIDGGGMSEMKNPPPASGRPTAVVIRNPNGEFINYYYPTPKGQEKGRIVIRAPEKQK